MPTSTPAVAFQRKAIERTLSVLKNHEAQILEPFRQIAGRRESYFRALTQSPGSVIEIFVYNDEVGFMVNGKEWRIFEKPDFPTEDEQLEAFDRALRSELAR